MLKINKRKLIIAAFAGIIYITTTAYHGGAAADGGLNRTGAKGSTAGCAGSGCHTGVSPTATAKIYLDTVGGGAVTGYKPGGVYTIRLVGKHASNRDFGFQFASVSGTGAAQIQAGTFSSTLPAGMIKTTMSGLDFLEHDHHISATSPADSVVIAINWTAPATNVGNITMYLAMNAINNNHNADALDYSATTSITVPVIATTVVSNYTTQSSKLSVYPNPASDIVHISATDFGSNTSLQIIDIAGKVVTPNYQLNYNTETDINIAHLPAGTYTIRAISGNHKINHLLIKK